MAAKTLQHTRRGLKMVGNKSLFDLDEPQWIADDSVSACQKCQQTFTMFNRRHHCRRCGKIYCGTCCSDFPLHRMGFVDPVKVCVECLPKCKSEDQFYKNQLKCLMKGSKFLLSGSSASDEVVHCCLSEDHYYLEFKPAREMVSMKEINEVNTGTGEDKVMTLRVKHKSGELLFTPSHETRKEGTEWLKALKKVPPQTSSIMKCQHALSRIPGQCGVYFTVGLENHYGHQHLVIGSGTILTEWGIQCCIWNVIQGEAKRRFLEVRWVSMEEKSWKYVGNKTY